MSQTRVSGSCMKIAIGAQYVLPGAHGRQCSHEVHHANTSCVFGCRFGGLDLKSQRMISPPMEDLYMDPDALKILHLLHMFLTKLIFLNYDG